LASSVSSESRSPASVEYPTVEREPELPPELEDFLPFAFVEDEQTFIKLFEFEWEDKVTTARFEHTSQVKPDMFLLMFGDILKAPITLEEKLIRIEERSRANRLGWEPAVAWWREQLGMGS